MSECLTIKIGSEHYGINLMDVQEVRSYQKPHARVGDAGVMDLRGEIVALRDLRQWLNSPAQDLASMVTVVVNKNGKTLGLVADEVCDVVAYDDNELKSLNNSQVGEDSKINALLSRDETLICMLNLPKIFVEQAH